MNMNSRTSKSLNWIIALVGLWELISPFVLGFSSLTSATVDAVIVGALLIIFGVVAALKNSASTTRTLDWLNVILGIWLIIAPFALGFATLTAAGYISSIIVGIVEIVLGIWAAVAAGRYVRTHAMATENMPGAVPVTGSDNGAMDNQIQNTVMDRLVQDPKVDATGINVYVDHGNVTLRGSVHSSDERHMAEEDARNVSGVRKVKDDLQVM